MDNPLGCLLLLLGTLGVYCFPRPVERLRYDGHRLIHVTPSNAKQLQALRDMEDNGFDFWKTPFLNHTVPFRVAPEHFDDIKSKLALLDLPFLVAMDSIQMRLDEEQEDLEKSAERRRFTSATVVGSFARHPEINAWLEEISTVYPTLSTIIDIGHTYEGRVQRVIKIGTRGINKPAIWMDAGIHAREWITIATMTYIIEKMLASYGYDSDSTQLLDKFDFYMLPVANPDGYEYTFIDRLWRKTRSQGDREGCIGVDPNRNFDFRFKENGVSNNPCSNTYPGPYAFSEMCTRNIADFITSIKQSLVLYLSLHAHAQFWLTPWAHTTTEPADNEEMLRVASIGEKALESVNGRKFTVGSPAKILYMASGVSYDWAKAKAGIKYSYTLELYPSIDAADGFVVKKSDIKPSGEEVLAAIKAVGQSMELK